MKTGQQQNLMYAQRKSFGTILTLSALGFFNYLVVALGGGGGFHPLP